MREKTMRGFAILVGLGSFVLGLGGCANEGGPLTVNARWVLSCPVGVSCDGSQLAHTVQGEEGDPGLAVSCDAIAVGDGLRAMTLKVIDGNNAGELSLRNVIFDDIGTVRATDGCQVTIEEKGVVYGPYPCGPAVPTEAQPCQIGNLTLAPDAAEGPTFATSVLCRGLKNSGAQMRDLISPDFIAGGAPVPLIVSNCGGI